MVLQTKEDRRKHGIWCVNCDKHIARLVDVGFAPVIKGGVKGYLCISCTKKAGLKSSVGKR